jgi:hypothetical protein
VDFRIGGLHDMDALYRLYCGIIGQAPGSPKENTEKIISSADSLDLVFSAGFFEDEQATIPVTNNIYSGETYYVKVTWKLHGKLAPHFCGVWQVKIDLESIGEAKEYTSPLRKIEMDPCQPDDESYETTFEITPDTVSPAEGGTVYLVAITLSSQDPCGQPGHIWAYGTGVSLMIVPGKAP